MAADQKPKEEKPQKKVTKTSLIQRYLKRHPDAKPREVVAALAKKGVEVTPATVSTIKNQMKNKGLLGDSPKAKQGRVAARRGRKPRRTSPAAGATLDMLKQAKSLAESAGGVDNAKKILDALAELQA